MKSVMVFPFANFICLKIEVEFFFLFFADEAKYKKSILYNRPKTLGVMTSVDARVLSIKGLIKLVENFFPKWEIKRLSVSHRRVTRNWIFTNCGRP